MRAPVGVAVLLALASSACEQYHPTAPDHMRPASARDRAFAAKVGEEDQRRRIINRIEQRAGPVVEPGLDGREGLVLWRLSLAGPVAIAEGTLHGRAFAGLYWVRDGKIIKRHELVGAVPLDPAAFAPTGATRYRAAGDLVQLRRARELLSGKVRPSANIVFRDARTGRDDGGGASLRAALGTGVRILDGWSIGHAAVVLTEDALYVVVFDGEKLTEVSRYAG